MRGRGIPMTYSGRNGGFTLLEVLLAFVVFALTFTTVLEILSGSMRNTVRARESLMDQLGLEIPLEQGTTVSGESGDYTWEINIYSYQDNSKNASSVELGELTGIELLQIDLAVTGGEPPRRNTKSFSTVRAMLANRKLSSE